MILINIYIIGRYPENSNFTGDTNLSMRPTATSPSATFQTWHTMSEEKFVLDILLRLGMVLALI